MIHRLVKTTPKPSATKKSKGELGPLPLPRLVSEGDAVGEAVSVALELNVEVMVSSQKYMVDQGSPGMWFRSRRSAAS